MKHSLGASGVRFVLSSSKPQHSNNLKIFTLPSDVLKIGFALGGWSGNAVARNRFKRIARKTIKSFYKNRLPVSILVQTKNKITLIKSLENEIIGLLSSSKTKKENK